MLRNLKLFGPILIAALMLGTAGTAFADRGCEERIERAQYRLDRAIQYRGFYSDEAQFRREQLRQVRDECRSGVRFYWNFNGDRDRDRDRGWDRDNR